MCLAAAVKNPTPHCLICCMKLRPWMQVLPVGPKSVMLAKGPQINHTCEETYLLALHSRAAALKRSERDELP